ncbi:MAG: hypothetical protein M1814_006478 [Vezdaea aestivalis]|nr:MAG: hypothetical protein M1814_006478 [Vezdaea aestivalis]
MCSLHSLSPPSFSSRFYLTMAIFSTVALFVALRFFVLLCTTGLAPVSALPSPQAPVQTPAGSGYWLANIERQGISAFNPDSAYKVWRNVKDYGAKGDGSTDDTEAINKAITDGKRCGQGCDSSTTTPALVFFPAGTYLVSKPVVALYYTVLHGDPTALPILKAAPSFQGMAVVDSDPYDNFGNSWYTNQNNFFRQVRNFVIDITAMPKTSGACIHWQVAQATSLQNIRFEMIKDTSDDNKQQGIFMDNGSGGFMTDLTFNGGGTGAFLGSQQFTTRNMTFNNVNTAIFMNWNWLWTFKSLSINNCKVGLNMSNGPMAMSGGVVNQTVGSVLVQDSVFSNTPIGVSTAYSGDKNTPVGGGTLIIDNCDFSTSAIAVSDPAGQKILAGNTKVTSWGQGKQYVTSSTPSASRFKRDNSNIRMRETVNPIQGSRVQGVLSASTSKPTSLVDSSGKVFERSKPQYADLPSSSFVSVKSKGAKGDGKTDDTAALQAALDSTNPDQILFIPHGAYLIQSTLKVPAKIRIIGEMWPILLATGPFFGDMANPKPVLQVGAPDGTTAAAVELSDIILSTSGPTPGAILMEWNVRDSSPGSCGIWDVHFRIGGFAGSKLQSDLCAKTPNSTTLPNPSCEAAFLLLHITKKATLYAENAWFWVADHELDLPDHGQINVYNGRGVLVESEGPVWLYGTSSEHSTLYNYQLNKAKDIYMALIQTETAYFQSNPSALVPFPPDARYADPDFAASCKASPTGTSSCAKTWGLRVVDSTDVLIFGAGLYSFFDNYGQDCLATESCQRNMLSVEGAGKVSVWGLSTKASENMVSRGDQPLVLQKENRSNFCSTVALFAQS